MDVDDFIARWTSREGGAERANYQMFLSELCDVIGVARPEPAGAERTHNDYVFERAVKTRESEGRNATLRIDLYKRGAFILEAKQSRTPAGAKTVPGQLSLLDDGPTIPAPSAHEPRGWDVMMQNARRQAEDYVFRLDADHPAPPFIIVCDVGRCLELYADFTGAGRSYNQFPDRNSFRLSMEDLRDPKVQDRLVKVWTDPRALDPTRESAQVTRGIAARLAQVSKVLEKDHQAEEVAHFLMRCIFTMFAEDVDLLPKGRFTDMLEECIHSPGSFAPLLEDLWSKMDEPDEGRRFFSGFAARLRHFNGNLFKDARAYPLPRELIGELAAAAKVKWTEVDPAIFGTLLEQALDPAERRQLGAHYTPRAYVQRLVAVTVMEPLRADWRRALTEAQQAKEDGKENDAIRRVRTFHHQLCATRVLDPACGTGNFLYVALEMMKQLEGEVIQALSDLGDTQANLVMQGETIDPHQFLGLELNPRAAAIAELVVWIGYLQWHYRNYASHPAEPILRAFKNIRQMDAVLTWDGYPVPKVEVKDGVRVESYPNARRPDWPEAEFIVGNPPFIGGKDLRSRLPTGYAEALWTAHPQMNESADFVMYWWDRSAELLVRKGALLRRFGLVTTNSISQVFQRRVMERHLSGKTPMSLAYAIPDHPWTKATRDSAAVRIAMTVAFRGSQDGTRAEVLHESGLDTDEPALLYGRTQGLINADLTVGVDVTKAGPLIANEGLCSPGVKLHGAGFIVTPAEAEHLGLGRRPGLERHIRPYRNGRDLNGHSRGAWVIDLDGLSAEEVRRLYPEVYQHVLAKVKPERDTNNEAYRRENWWLFGRKNTIMRGFTANLPRFIATVETSKHRTFQFLDASILPDNMLLNVGSGDGFLLAALSSNLHVTWALAAGGTLEDRPRYNKVRTFDPFPFPDPPEGIKARLRALGEELDATRKAVQAEHPDLTLTGLYNVLEKLKAGMPLDVREEDAKVRGRVLILKELHEQIDAATADAYGWPRDLADEQILERLVALNAERAREEAAGRVHWLRPDYQIPRFARGAATRSGELDLGEAAASNAAELPAFPKDPYEQASASMAALGAAGRPMAPAELARAFKRGGRRIEQRLVQILSAQARYGGATALPDGRFVARRAA